MICEISSKFNFWTKIGLLTQCGVHRSFFTGAMGGQIQKLFRRLKRFVIKFLAHSLVKVHMILHKKVSSWRIAKWKCLFDNTAWRCNNRIRRTQKWKWRKNWIVTHVLMILNVRSREFIKMLLLFTCPKGNNASQKMSILLLKWLKIIKNTSKASFV